MVVIQRVEWYEAFDEEVGEFHEESELGYADDQAVEVFPNAALHKLYFFPFHEAAFGFVGAAFGLAGFLGDAVELFDRDRSAARLERLLMRVAVAALGPGSSAGVPPAGLRAQVFRG